jgi:hypothetical protein
MPIGTDFSVTATGDIRHEVNTNTYTVLELHRWLQDLADNESVTGSSDDVVDITSSTPSERSTDNIIKLLGTYNIDDDAAEYFYDGSIKQGSGATETLYAGLRVLGAVNQSATQLQVIQENGLYDTDTPFWGTQATGGLNGDAAQGILMRCLIKVREFGADIDKKRIKVTARHYGASEGDSYAFFDVLMGEGESVAALTTVSDPQNDTAKATVTAYTHVTNTEGFQQIDIGDGNGNQPYYSKWTYGVDTSGDQLKGVYEFVKDLVAQGTAKTIHGMDGELFFGITHSYTYDNLSGTFTEDETVVWGTDVTYDGLSGGTFSAGDYVRIGASGAAGRVMYDNGSTNMIVALENTSITLLDDDVITEASAGTVTASIAVTILNNDKDGGSGVLLASDATGTKHHLQTVTGVAPVDNSPIRGLSSAATCDVAGSVTAQTVQSVFLGSYTGSLIGAFGIGIDSGDLTSTDTVQDLDGDVNTPPNNVTFTVSGCEVSEDRVLVGPKDTGNDFEFDQMTLATALTGGTETEVVVNAIPDNTPATGTLRITLDDGRVRRQAYTAHDGVDTFDIASTSYVDPDDASISNGVMCSYIDKLATTGDETYTTIYDSAQTLWVRVRDGGTAGDNEPIKTFEAQASLGAAGGSSTVIRTPDV